MEKYVNEKTIVKDSIYDLFNETIKCHNCKCIMIDPVICLSCQNTFCKKCKEKLKENGENCPGKCNSPNIAEVKEKNNYISKFKFKCIKNCGAEIMFKDIKNHYSSDCLSKIPKAKALTSEEAEKYKIKKGKKIPKLTRKYNNIILIFININFWNSVITLGSSGVGKSSLINT